VEPLQVNEKEQKIGSLFAFALLSRDFHFRTANEHYGRLTNQSIDKLLQKTGAHLWINWSATVIPDLIGQPAYGLVVVQDVTEPQNAVCARQYRTEFEHLNHYDLDPFHFSVDDFGTGYSSLSYLKRFPVTSLKIDRAFVHDVNTDPGVAALARAIIAMGHSLGLEVVGEGVEPAEQLTFLRAEHCDMAQGYFFSQPVPSADFLQLLKTWGANAFVRDQASTR
jgi:hypothetical protein